MVRAKASGHRFTKLFDSGPCIAILAPEISGKLTEREYGTAFAPRAERLVG